MAGTDPIRKAGRIRMEEKPQDHVIQTPVFLTGLHRSGTTWVGRIIAEASKEAVIHEPLNRSHGMRRVPCWYPYHPGGNALATEAPHAAHMEAMLEGLVEGRARWVRTNPNARLHRRIGQVIVGTRAERDYRAAFRKGGLKRLFVKDPFCLFVSPHLIERFDARVVITIRHPGALIVSMRRMGWSPDIGSLVAQPGLMERYLPEYSVRQITEGAAEDDIFANAVFWLAAKRFSHELADRFPDHVFILRHEEISTGAKCVLEQLLAHLGLEDGLIDAAAFVMKTTSGKTVVPAAGVLHDFSRDAAVLRQHWRKKLTEDEQARLTSLLSSEFDVADNTKK